MLTGILKADEMIQVVDDMTAMREDWKIEVTRRYQQGECRSPIFRDVIQESIRQHGDRVLDIGCGHGFDDNAEMQQSIASLASHFVGIEPDPEIQIPEYFNEVHHSVLESAPLRKHSIDVAYSVFVLEHIKDADLFWQKIDDVLAPGGVFWGFTVDGRHPFRMASDAMESIGVKDFYLNRIQGRRGEERYENYPTWYRANTPRSIDKFTDRFATTSYLSLHRPGQLDYYFPQIVRPMTRTCEWLMMKARCPGSVLVVRAEKHK